MIEPTSPPPCLARGDCECLVSLGDIGTELNQSRPYSGRLWVEMDGTSGLTAQNETVNAGDMIESGVVIRIDCGQCSCANGALQCSKSNCSNDCQWAQWEAWTPCSSSCGTGVRYRNRTIASPARFGGEVCHTQQFQEAESCNTQQCPCVWSQWAAWSDCSEPCNGGLKTRRRTAQGSCHADDSREETALCNVHPCGATTTAAGACTDGKVMRDCSTVSCPHTCAQVANETCTEALTCTTGCFCAQGSVFDEKVQACVTPDRCTCDLTSVQCGACSQATCVNGVAKCTPSPNCDCTWDSWADWTPCSQECGAGNRTRSRSYATVRRGSGRPCTGPSTESEGCKKADCAGCLDRFGNLVPAGATIHSEDACKICYCSYFGRTVCSPKAVADPTKPAPFWSQWSSFSSCSSPCGTGNRHRTRSCLHVCPSDDRQCPTDSASGLRSSDQQSCNEQSCQPRVDCKVSDWRNGSCSAECDGINPSVEGQQTNIRDIVRMPANGGQPCSKLQETVACTKQCRVDSSVGEWSEWSECAKTCVAGDVCNPSCGIGSRERTRPIERPASNGGIELNDKEYKLCHMPCNETVCSGPETTVACATKCWRTCEDVRANKKCSDLSCSAGCGCAGDTVRDGAKCVAISQCSCANPSNSSQMLPPGSVITKDCNTCTCDNGRFVCEKKNCVQDCEWSPWQQVGACNVTCGTGKQNWSRSELKPSANGGAECAGPRTKLTDCFGDQGACCNPNDAYVDTGRCEPTCEQLLQPGRQQAGSSCSGGCQCKPGMVRSAASGQCISLQECFACSVNGQRWPNGKEELSVANCTKRYCLQGQLVVAAVEVDEAPACTQADELLASLTGSTKVMDRENCCYRASLDACRKSKTLLREARRPGGSICRFRQPISIERCAGACPASNTLHINELGEVKVMGECSCCKPTGHKQLAPRAVDCVEGGSISVRLFTIDSCACDMKRPKWLG